MDKEWGCIKIILESNKELEKKLFWSEHSRYGEMEEIRKLEKIIKSLKDKNKKLMETGRLSDIECFLKKQNEKLKQTLEFQKKEIENLKKRN